MPGRALIPKALVPRALSSVSYLTRGKVARLAAACQGRNQVQGDLLIQTLFQTGVRISEALSLTTAASASMRGEAVVYNFG
jgi:integrase